MNHNQNSLQQFLAQQSLLKGHKTAKSTFLSHQKYVQEDRAVNRTQVLYKKQQDKKGNLSYLGKKSDRKKEGLKLDQIQHVQRSLNDGRQVSQTTYTRPQEPKQQVYRPYFASRVQPRPLPAQQSTKQQVQPLKKPQLKDLQIDSSPQNIQKGPQIQQNPHESHSNPINVNYISQKEKQIDDKINISISRSGVENKEQLISEIPQQQQNKYLAVNNPSESQKKQIRMQKTDSFMMIDSFGKSSARQQAAIENSKRSIAKESQIINRQGSNYNRGSNYLQQEYFINERPGSIYSARDYILNNYVPTPTPTPSQQPKQQQYLDQTQQLSDRQTFFLSTKRDTSRYIQKLHNELMTTHANLQSIEKEIDSQIEKNLENECQKMRLSLYKSIQNEIKEFRQIEKKKLATAKLTFMADLYQIKSNIDLRVKELDQYKQSLNTQQKWKTVVGDLLTPDYQATINFVHSKAEELQQESFIYAQKFLNNYNTKMFYQIHQPFKKQMRQAIQSLFINFVKKRQKKKHSALVSKVLGDNPKISDLDYQ